MNGNDFLGHMLAKGRERNMTECLEIMEQDNSVNFKTDSRTDDLVARIFLSVFFYPHLFYLSNTF